MAKTQLTFEVTELTFEVTADDWIVLGRKKGCFVTSAGGSPVLSHLATSAERALLPDGMGFG